jgi:hypothetical protein
MFDLLTNQEHIDEFAKLCKLMLGSSKVEPDRFGTRRLDWKELVIYHDERGLRVKWRSEDGTFISTNYLYEEQPGIGIRVHEPREIRRWLPELRRATVLDRLANV